MLDRDRRRASLDVKRPTLAHRGVRAKTAGLEIGPGLSVMNVLPAETFYLRQILES